MASSQRLLLAAIVALAVMAQASAGDGSPLQDFCVADLESDVLVNGLGLPCKNPREATADDFFFQALRAGSTMNQLGFSMKLLDANAIPGLNTLGISFARLGFASRGLNQPHIHPRATEVMHVLQGSLVVGFVSSSPDNKLFIKNLRAGDVFVFPAGLVHFQLAGDSGVLAISAFSSQNPGLVVVGDSVFGAKPSMPDEALSKTFGVGKDIIDQLKAHFQLDLSTSMF